MVIAVILGATTDLHITVPSIIVVFFFISFVTFPIVSVIKIGYKRSLKWSKLSTEANVIIYDKLAEKCGRRSGMLKSITYTQLAKSIV